MEKYVFYSKTTGNIHFIKKMYARDAEANCCKVADMCCMPEKELGVIFNKEKVKIDLETMALVKKQPIVKSFDSALRERRNLRLKMCDWTQAVDSPLSEAKRAEWAVYRQSLRDLPVTCVEEGCNNLGHVHWPQQPE